MSKVKSFNVFIGNNDNVYNTVHYVGDVSAEEVKDDLIEDDSYPYPNNIRVEEKE